MRLLQLLTLLAVFSLSACESTYFAAMEKVGYQKREIMADRISEVAEAQTDAQTQFKSALEQFNSVVNFQGGDLERLYNQLNNEYEESEDAAETIRDRIEAVKSVSTALFEEWEQEIGLYSSQSLKRSSEKQLASTKQKYKKLVSAMEKSENSLQPVLNTFRDQVLFLKHNLNAQAISSLKGELSTINKDVDALIKSMDISIKEAKGFIKTLQTS